MRWIFALFVISAFLYGCTLFRKATPEERAWRRIEYAHKEETAKKLSDMDTRHTQEMHELKDKLWQDYQTSLAASRSEIERKYLSLEMEAQKTFGGDQTSLKIHLKSLSRQKDAEISKREDEIYAEYKMRRNTEIAALVERQKQEREELIRLSEAELSKKRMEFELALERGELPGEGVIVATTPGEFKEMRSRKEPFAEVEARPFYVHKFVAADMEAVVPIDTRDALVRREFHQAVITFYLVAKRDESSKEKKGYEVFLRLNGELIPDWSVLIKKLTDFRNAVYRANTAEFPEVILDQIGDVTRETVDKIIDCCFLAGIRHIRSANKEPKIEQP
ncbi:MAG: hypothetical protein N2234_07615 [Planctomycetota bacterium]|nr:hypothetical protein [Planctomycetota bacterium]